MKTTSLLAVVVLLAASESLTVAQVKHNNWIAGAPEPTPVWDPAAAVLNGQVYVVGGNNNDRTIIADTQIYNPSTNSWSAGVALPTPTAGAVAAVVNNTLYVIGGCCPYTDAVWAFDPATQTWSSKAAMPLALNDAGVAVENGIIYVVGGNSNNNLRETTVESYNPATDAWTYAAPLWVGRSEPSVGLVGNKSIGYSIVAADGFAAWGDTEGYNANTNTWTTLKADPYSPSRSWACTGGIGVKLYVVGGLNDWNGACDRVNKSFNLAKNAWGAHARMPQPAMATASAVYGGKLYCIGGTTDYTRPGTNVNNVQIYYP